MNTSELTIGLDLGDRRHHLCVLSAAGEIIAEEVLPNTRECLSAFAARYPGATVIVETGTHSPWVSRLLAQCGHPVLVANARKLRAISASHTKNDAEDARMLARLGRADPALLRPIKHRSEQGQRTLARLKVREALVRSRVTLINSVRFLLKSLGVFVSASIKGPPHGVASLDALTHVANRSGGFALFRPLARPPPLRNFAAIARPIGRQATRPRRRVPPARPQLNRNWLFSCSLIHTPRSTPDLFLQEAAEEAEKGRPAPPPRRWRRKS